MTLVASRATEPRSADGGARPPATPFQVLQDMVPPSRDVRGAGMPESLARRYGGELVIPLRPDRPTIVANFVSTLDGVVALGDGPLAGGGLISGGFEPDRFVMALLRATADVVIVGAGTLRGSSRQRWIAEHVQPGAAGALAAWRRSMGLAPFPTTVFITRSGAIPTGHPGLSDPAIPVVVATSPSGAARLRDAALGEHVRVESIGRGEPLTGTDLMALGACLGARVVLTEGGPHVLGALLADDLVDELFLTLAPQLIGRGLPDTASHRRLGLVEGLALPAGGGRWTELRSIRRAGDHLFLRYGRAADAADRSTATAAREH